MEKTNAQPALKVNLKSYERNIGTFADEELEEHARRNQTFGLKHRKNPGIWDASCRMARIIREELEARTEVRQYAARVRAQRQPCLV